MDEGVTSGCAGEGCEEVEPNGGEASGSSVDSEKYCGIPGGLPLPGSPGNGVDNGLPEGEVTNDRETGLPDEPGGQESQGDEAPDASAEDEGCSAAGSGNAGGLALFVMGLFGLTRRRRNS